MGEGHGGPFKKPSQRQPGSCKRELLRQRQGEGQARGSAGRLGPESELRGVTLQREGCLGSQSSSVWVEKSMTRMGPRQRGQWTGCCGLWKELASGFAPNATGSRGLPRAELEMRVWFPFEWKMGLGPWEPLGE